MDNATIQALFVCCHNEKIYRYRNMLMIFNMCFKLMKVPNPSDYRVHFNFFPVCGKTSPAIITRQTSHLLHRPCYNVIINTVITVEQAVEHAVQAIRECFIRNAKFETDGPLYLEPDELQRALSKLGWNIGFSELEVYLRFVLQTIMHAILKSCTVKHCESVR